jgi:hypothetical protein
VLSLPLLQNPRERRVKLARQVLCTHCVKVELAAHTRTDVECTLSCTLTLSLMSASRPRSGALACICLRRKAPEWRKEAENRQLMC